MKVALAALMIAFWALTYSTVVGATGWHVVKPPVVVSPPVVAPPVVSAPPVAPPATPAAPAQQPAQGGGGFNPGYIVMAGVALFFYAVICTAERGNNPDGWFAKNCKPSWME